MKCVLMVDDDADLRETSRDLFRLRMQQSGISVTIREAASGEEALDLFLRDPTRFDLIISDYHMGDRRMNGMDLLRSIRATSRDHGPVVLFTGRDLVDTDQALLLCLNGHHVRKPNHRLLSGLARTFLQ